MLELNKVMLIGNLTRDPETSTIGSGTSLAKLGVAVNRRWKDRNSGEMREETAFVDIDAWGSTADFCGRYLKKGRRIFIEGSLKFETWQAQDGSKRSKLGVRADSIQFADPKPRDDDTRPNQGGSQDSTRSRHASAQQDAFGGPATSSPNTSDDMPF